MNIRIFRLFITVLAAVVVAGKSPAIRQYAQLADRVNHDTMIVKICGERREVNDYRDAENHFLDVVRDFGYDPQTLLIVASENLTDAVLEHRSGAGFLIVERVIGICTNAETGDGKILNCDSPYDNYINYTDCTERINEGTVVLTYLIYADNDYTDDIADRFDYVLDREYED